ncbi:unnamed protein product [Eruca vesicaria subsp. sativa]|uniref:Chromo domain-containing protein n=1 Tax=Eruca vesicaria subsp. sativa TaxID=29727 RepID=A0ABC8LD78_ERUVS|nr:unnamed protein product [Eruca vesicaria subsp. sativa]
MKGARVEKKTHLVNAAGEADTAVETAPKLPQEFYEVEAIRSKRFHKGKVQYLIKWRNWPETTNTWEPLKNLETIPAAIKAYEKSLRKASKKRKGNSGGSSSQCKKKKEQQRVTSTPVVAPNSGSVGEEQEYDPTLNELRGPPVVNSNGAGGGIGSKGDDGLLKVKKVDKKYLRGAKRRKSGMVRRYIPNETTSNNNENQTPATEQNQTPATEQNQTQATEQNPFDFPAPGSCDLPKKEEEVAIVRVIRPVGVSTYKTNNAVDALVTFSALRSDGVEVTVDNQFLRVYNPQLLLDFYEQNIKYKTEGEENVV